MFRFLFISFLLLRAGLAFGLGQMEDTLAKAKSRQPVFFRMGADLSRIFLSNTRSNFSGFEVSANGSFNRWVVEFYGGYAKHQNTLSNFDAWSSGSYGSIGISRNSFSDQKNLLLFGLRLAGSSYQYQPRNINLGAGTPLLELAQEKHTALWLELVGAIRSEILPWLMVGFEVRVKPRIYASMGQQTPYQTPGYGLNENNISLGFNYYAFITLPSLRK